MTESLSLLSEKLHLKEPIELSNIKAKGNFRKDKRHYTEVLTEEEQEMIAVIWAREMKLLSYKF